MASNWPTTPLSDLCDTERGITYGIVKVGEFIPDGVPVVRGGDIRDGRILCDDSKRVTKEVSDQFRRTILKGGEIVLNLIADPGHSAIVPVELAGHNVSRDVAVIPLNGTADVRFVDFFLKSNIAVDWLTARLQGSVTQKINLGTLRDLPVPLPSILEQRRIAYILGTLDDKIELNRRMNGTLESMARALFQSWFVDFDPVRAKQQGREPAGLDPATAALFPAEFEPSELGEIPKGWTACSLKDIADIFSGGTPKKETLSYWDGQIPWISPKAMNDIHVHDSDDHVSELAIGDGTRLVPKGSVFVMVRGMGLHQGVRISQARCDVTFNQDVKAFVPEKVDSTFLLFSILHAQEWLFSKVQSSGHGTGVLPTDILQSVPIVVPPPSICAELTASLQSMNEKIAANTEQCRTLAALRDALLPKLLSGELSVANSERLLDLD